MEFFHIYLTFKNVHQCDKLGKLCNYTRILKLSLAPTHGLHSCPVTDSAQDRPKLMFIVRPRQTINKQATYNAFNLSENINTRIKPLKTGCKL